MDDKSAREVAREVAKVLSVVLKNYRACMKWKDGHKRFTAYLEGAIKAYLEASKE